GDRHQKLALPHQLDGERSGLDLDQAVAEANVERHAWRDPRLLANLLRDHSRPVRIDGSYHGTDPTRPDICEVVVFEIDGARTTAVAAAAQRDGTIIDL